MPLEMRQPEKNVAAISAVDPARRRSVEEEGGLAYVKFEMRAAKGDADAAEVATEMAWEQLHSGPWHAVAPAWRDAYAMACLHVARYKAAAGGRKEAIRALDMGLIMGGMTLRGDLEEAIGRIHGGAAERNGVGDAGLEWRGSYCDESKVGKNYLTPEWKQELITFSDFLERIQSECCPERKTYLAQHPLFDQIQELRNDIMIPDYCFTAGGILQSLNAWFGPAGTVTPLHHDPHHNLLSQVVGKRYIRLYPPSASEELHPYSESMLTNSSQVDLDDPDVKKFPRVKDLEFMDCILSEGEMLYIPPKWWHYVRSLTPSFSVSFWWSFERGAFA